MVPTVRSQKIPTALIVNIKLELTDFLQITNTPSINIDINKVFVLHKAERNALDLRVRLGSSTPQSIHWFRLEHHHHHHGLLRRRINSYCSISPLGLVFW